MRSVAAIWYGRITSSISSEVKTQYRASTLKRVCLAKKVFVKSIKSGITWLLPSAQKEVNSKLLLVFLDFARPASPCSLRWLARVVLL